MSSVRILCYHAINQYPHGARDYRYGVPLARFQEQIEQLSAAGYEFIDTDALLAFLRRDRRLPDRAVLLTFDDCYANIAPAVKWLAAQRIRGIAFAIAGALTPGTPIEGMTEPLLLDRDGLAELVEHGFEIGAHSDRHPCLPRITPEQRQQEIVGSVARLREAGLGEIRVFAYPYGQYNRAVYEDVRRSGVLAAMTIDKGRVRRGDDPFRLKRIEIYADDHGAGFLRKVATGGVDPLRAAWGSLRRQALMSRVVHGGAR